MGSAYNPDGKSGAHVVSHVLRVGGGRGKGPAAIVRLCIRRGAELDTMECMISSQPRVENQKKRYTFSLLHVPGPI